MIKVSVTMPAEFADPAEFLADARALEAAGADMIGVDGDGPRQWIVLGAIAAVTERIQLRLNSSESAEILQRLSRGRAVLEQPAEGMWIEIAMPPDRDSWTAELRRHEEAGITGVIVPWNLRLIDLLRNPAADDRSDLLMSTG